MIMFAEFALTSASSRSLEAQFVFESYLYTKVQEALLKFVVYLPASADAVVGPLESSKLSTVF